MAKIALSDTSFALVPEGTHVFKITAVNYKEDFGKLEITMKTAKGETHTERYTFVKKDGSPNEPAINVFSFLAKTALQDFDLEEIDHEDLIGRFIKAEVTHETVPNQKDETKTMTFSRLGQKFTADGFEEEAPVAPKKTAPTVAKTTVASKPVATTASAPKKVDLASILGKK